jgi:hypothetical protein
MGVSLWWKTSLATGYNTIEKAINQFFALSLAELIYHQKAISFLCAPPAAVEWIWAARKKSLPRITGARTATKSSGASATSCPARAANRRIPKLPGNIMSEHLLEMAKARVRVKDGKIATVEQNIDESRARKVIPVKIGRAHV